MNKILVDTNILIYAIDKDSLYFEKAQDIIQNTTLYLYTTSKNISEFLAVITKGPENGLSIDDALNAVNEYISFLKVLYPNQNTYKHFMKLLKKYNPMGLKIHDFEIASIGITNAIEQIATFNQKDFQQIEEISVYTP